MSAPENTIAGTTSLPDAITRSGGKRPRNAPKIAPATFWHVIERAPQGAGGFGLTMVPAGALMCTASNNPAFGSNSGSSSATSALSSSPQNQSLAPSAEDRMAVRVVSDPVPDVVGEPYANAESAIRGAGFVPVRQDENEAAPRRHRHRERTASRQVKCIQPE